MTNKPMLSVERNLLGLSSEAYSVMLGMVEHCLNIRACMGMDEGFKCFDTEEEHAFVVELRALLDKQETPYKPSGTWSFDYIDGGDIVIRNGKDWTLVKKGDGPIYEQFLYRFCEEQMKPAAINQDYPVNRLAYSKGDRRYVNGWNDACSHWEECIAPVDGSTTSDKYKAELYDEVWELARKRGYNNVTDALSVTPVKE